MKERPIIFSGPMVRAILDGRKSQTRRLVSKSNSTGGAHGWEDLRWDRQPLYEDNGYLHVPSEPHWAAPDDDIVDRVYPRISPGDVLWVRETWRPNSGAFNAEAFQGEFGVDYKADGRTIWHDITALDLYPHGDTDVDSKCWLPKHAPYDPWRPSIHMPRWACRLRLLVKSVRVERLQDISQEDARAEGAEGGCVWCGVPNGTCDCERPRPDYRDGFVNVWHAIHGPNSWPSNPWVWVYEFGLQK